MHSAYSHQCMCNRSLFPLPYLFRYLELSPAAVCLKGCTAAHVHPHWHRSSGNFPRLHNFRGTFTPPCTAGFKHLLIHCAHLHPCSCCLPVEAFPATQLIPRYGASAPIHARHVVFGISKLHTRYACSYFMSELECWIQVFGPLSRRRPWHRPSAP